MKTSFAKYRITNPIAKRCGLRNPVSKNNEGKVSGRSRIFCLIILLCWFVLPSSIHAQSIELAIIDSISNKPVENVYVYDNSKNFLSLSDKAGVCQLNMKDNIPTAENLSISISHIGYNKKMIELAQLSSDKKIEIRLSPKTFELGEISISPPNAENIVQKAIENIDKNYYSLYGDTIDLNVNFLFFDNPDHRIADFKGQIAVTNNRNNLSAAKYSVAKHAINESFYDYKAEISPNGFYSVLFIKSHAVIRKAKKMKFHFEEIVKYQGNDVYKISFQYNSRYINLSGYMFINMDDYAITYLTYELGECKKWLASTHKSKGMIYTNLEHYRCYTSFVKNDDRYRFSNGSINMLFNQSKKHKILSHNTYNVTVKRIARTTERNGLIFTNVNNLFKKLQ